LKKSKEIKKILYEKAVRQVMKRIFVFFIPCLLTLQTFSYHALADVQSGRELSGVTLSLKGIKRYEDFAQLKAFLQSQSHTIKSIYPCRIESGQATFNLRISGSFEHILRELENSGKYIVNKNQFFTEILLFVKEEAP